MQYEICIGTVASTRPRTSTEYSVSAATVAFETAPNLTASTLVNVCVERKTITKK